MHANRNKEAIKKVEKGMMRANRIRNTFAVLAIVLTTFMITTVFSLGINYMQNFLGYCRLFVLAGTVSGKAAIARNTVIATRVENIAL